MKNVETIDGTNVYLKPISIHDTALIVKWRNSDFVRNRFLFRERVTEEVHENWMKKNVSTGNVVQFIICTKDNNPIGSVYYRDVDNSKKTAEFGIFIGEEASLGKGFGLEATELFVEYGFSNLKFERIFLRVIATNIRAICMYKKIGFTILNEESVVLKPSGERVCVVFMEICNNA